MVERGGKRATCVFDHDFKLQFNETITFSILRHLQLQRLIAIIDENATTELVGDRIPSTRLVLILIRATGDLQPQIVVETSALNLLYLITNGQVNHMVHHGSHGMIVSLIHTLLFLTRTLVVGILPIHVSCT